MVLAITAAQTLLPLGRCTKPVGWRVRSAWGLLYAEKWCGQYITSQKIRYTGDMEKTQAKELNKEAVSTALHELLHSDLEVNKQYRVPLAELQLKGHRVTDAELRFQVSGFDISRGNAIIEIASGKHQIALRDFMIGQMGEEDRAITTITGGITSHQALEGSGIATALMEATNDIVPKILDLLEVPAEQEAIYVVTDRAKGTATDRTGWTSHQMQKLGFIHNVEQAEQLSDVLQLNLSDEELEKTFFKVY